MPDEDLSVSFSVDDCTFEELEELEDLLDIPFDDFFTGKRRAKVMRGLAFVELRRRNPEFTWDDAAKLTIGNTTGSDKKPDPPTADA